MLSAKNFFKSHNLGNPLLSPSGSYLAFNKVDHGVRTLFCLDLNRKKTSRLSAPGHDLSRYRWIGDHWMAALMDTDGDECYCLYVVDIRESKTIQVGSEFSSNFRFVDYQPASGDTFLVAGESPQTGYFDIYSFNWRTGLIALHWKNPGNASQWCLSPSGSVAGYLSINGLTQNISALAEGTVLWSREMKGEVNLLSSPFPSKFLILSTNESGLKCLFLIGEDPIDDVLLSGNLSVDLDNVKICPQSLAANLVEYEDDIPRTSGVSKWGKCLVASLSAQLNRPWKVASRNLDGTIVVAKAIYSDRLPEYFLFKEGQSKEKLLLGSEASIRTYATTESFLVNSGDGLDVPAQIVLPKEREESLPVVLMVHGGPWYRDRWEYHAPTQFLASLGYAVLKINFRGSTGFGVSHKVAGYKQWGKAMQQDLYDVLDYALENFSLDSDRVAIMGCSYGGYATLMGTSLGGNRFRCGVSIMGISDLNSFLESVPKRWKKYRKMLNLMIGDPENEREILKSYSPIEHAHKIQCPMLIAHGRNDARVKVEESQKIVDELVNNSVPHVLKIFENEGHGFTNADNRIELYDEISSFLDRYL